MSYIPPEKVLPETTVLTVILGAVLAVVLGAANAYLGLFAGLTVSASIPAAVIALAVLKPLGGNILQSNSVQTAASAGESLAAGVIFTIPALLLMGSWQKVQFLETLLLTGLGGLLGVLFTIPLRRALIVEQPLKFPEGVATAEVLKVGDQGGGGFRFIGIGGAVGALFKLGAAAEGFMLWTEKAKVAFSMGGSSVGYVGTSLSPALVGVGYIVGINIAILVFLGGVSQWLIAIPVVSSADPSLINPDDLVATAKAISSSKTRYLGVGAMMIGGLWALIRLMPSLVRGIRASLQAYSAAGQGAAAVLRTEKDTPMKWVLVLAALSLLPLFFVSMRITGSPGMAVVMALFMLIAGFLFSAVAAYMAGLVGSSNNPISGITIATVLTAALALKALGLPAGVGPAAALFIGAVVCSAAAIGGDNMQDLKAGHVLGSTPFRLQIMQVIGVVAAVGLMPVILNLLHKSYGIGPGTALEAPQASLMASVAKGIFSGDLPWGFIAAGVIIGALIIGIDVILEIKKSKFRTPVLAYAVGIYLPIELSVPIFIGGLIAYLIARHKPEDQREASGPGLLLAAGLITGEALLGILLAIPVAATGSSNPLRLFSFAPIAAPGLVLLALVAFLLYRTGRKA